MSGSARSPVLVVGGMVLTAVVVVTTLRLAGAEADRPAPAASAGTSAQSAGTSSASSGAGSVAPIDTLSPGQDAATDPAPVRTGGAVDPMITYAAWEGGSSSIAVNGYVAGVVEVEGTCRLTLIQGSQILVDENQAEPDASTMNCGLLEAAGADVTAGTWRAVLSYESATSSGSSPSVDVEVPAR